MANMVNYTNSNTNTVSGQTPATVGDTIRWALNTSVQPPQRRPGAQKPCRGAPQHGEGIGVGFEGKRSNGVALNLKAFLGDECREMP